MSRTGYRLTCRGFASSSDMRKVVLTLQRELGLPTEVIHDLLISPPRIAREFEGEQDAENARRVLAENGCLCDLEAVIRYPALSFTLPRDKDLLIRKELSKVLRSRSSMVILLVRIPAALSGVPYPSIRYLAEECFQETFRTSDTVVGTDDHRFIVLAFASDAQGLIHLKNKTMRQLSAILSGDVEAVIGHAVFPEEAQSLEGLLELASVSRESLENEAVPPPALPEGRSTATPECYAPEKASPIHLCFTQARGRIFHRILGMDPEILRFGLSQLTHAEQKAFLARLPFSSPLAPQLTDTLARTATSALSRDAESHFSAVIHQMELEPGLARRKEMMTQVLAALKMSDDLPTLPSVAGQIFSLASDPNASGRKLAQLVGNDPALTSKILKTVNSAFYGFPQKISSVEYAITILGMDEIVDLAFGLAAARVFDSTRVRNLFDPRILWHHSLCTALIVKNLYRQYKGQREEGVFSAGLLHDVGKIFFADHFTDLYGKATQAAEKQGHPVYEFEEDLFGINHAEIGNFLSVRWNLPASLVQAIAYHHQPFSAPDHPELAAMTGLADYLYYRARQKFEPQAAEIPARQFDLTNGHHLVLKRTLGMLDAESLEAMTRRAWEVMEENRPSLPDLD